MSHPENFSGSLCHNAESKQIPGAVGKDVAGCPKFAGEQQPLAGPQALTVEAAALTAEDEPLVLAVEPQAPAWAQRTVRFLQTGELPEE